MSAGVVTVTIANRWTGNDVYWLAFTVGLAFAACVLLALLAELEETHDN